MDRDGVEGAWVPAYILRAVLVDRAELETSRQQVSLLDEELGLRRAQVEALGVAVERAAQRAESLDRSIEAAVRGRREAEDELDAWYRSPYLWAGVGVAGTVGLTLLGAWAAGAL